jgi:type I restriction enzyme M protein
MFEQAFRNIDDVLWKDAGCTSELDYTEQTSWLLFLKYLDALEHEKATEAALDGRKYTHILDTPYRWESWAAPKGKDPSAGSGQAAKIDHNTAQTGDDLLVFVNGKLFPYATHRRQRLAKSSSLFPHRCTNRNESSRRWPHCRKKPNASPASTSVGSPRWRR